MSRRDGFAPWQETRRAWGNLTPFGREVAYASAVTLLVLVVAVFALLGILLVQLGTGLLADDEIANLGPLNRFVANSRDPGNVIGRIAFERLKLNDLFRGQTVVLL
jgi:hypothetical protein